MGLDAHHGGGLRGADDPHGDGREVEAVDLIAAQASTRAGQEGGTEEEKQ